MSQNMSASYRASLVSIHGETMKLRACQNKCQQTDRQLLSLHDILAQVSACHGGSHLWHSHLLVREALWCCWFSYSANINIAYARRLQLCKIILRTLINPFMAEFSNAHHTMCRKCVLQINHYTSIHKTIH